MPATTYRATVERIDVLSYNVRSFRFKLIEPPRLDFKAGQFVILNVPHEGKTVKRAYSVASPPHEPQAVELCVQHVEGGVASTYFWTGSRTWRPRCSAAKRTHSTPCQTRFYVRITRPYARHASNYIPRDRRADRCPLL